MSEALNKRLWVAFCAALVLGAIDVFVFPFTYAAAFVDFKDHVRLVLLTACVACFNAPVLAIALSIFVAVISHRVTKKIKPALIPPIFSISLTLFLVAVVNQSAGKIFDLAPWWQNLAALAVGAIYYVIFRFVDRKWPADHIGPALFSAFVGGVFLLTYIPLFLKGGFGFSGHSQTVMRTAMTSAIVFVTAAIPIAYIVWQQVWRRLPPFILYLVTIATLVVAHIVNITLYVDNYPEIHNFIALFSIGLALDVVTRLFETPPKRTFVVVAVLFHVGLFGVVMARQTNPGYVGAVHTGWVRYGLQVFHHDIGNAPRNVRNFFVKNRYRIEKRLGKKRTVQSVGTLHGTFAPVLPSANHNVVWLLLDMKRPEEFTKDATPETFSCFENGTHFDVAYTNAPKTNIAYPALYTSTYPATRHENQNTITEDPFWFSFNQNYNAGSIFSAAGFATSVVTNEWYDTQFFSKQNESTYFSGFQKVVTEAGAGSHTQKLQNGFDQNRDVIPATGNYFTVFHIFEHWPEQLNEVDKFIGSVCDEIKTKNRWHDTVVMLAADHGVQRREHGRTHYGMTLFEEETRVPMMVHMPGESARRTFTHTVSLLDLLPTSVSLAGIQTPAQFEGRSLFSTEPRDIFLETRLLSFPSSAIVSGRWKLIRWRKTGHEALFGLADDPDEIENLIEKDTERADALRARLDAFLEARNETVWP